MKRLFLFTILITACIILMAQPPQGGGRQGGMRGDRPDRPRMGHPMQQNSKEVMLSHLPEIEGLTLKQREKLSKAITDEHKSIKKYMEEKHQLMMQIDPKNPNVSTKDLDKNRKKVEKIENNIKKAEEKADKKYRSILSSEQYISFTEKKKEIQFKGHRNQMKARENRPPMNRMDDGNESESMDKDFF